jgi:hypothetical protein
LRAIKAHKTGQSVAVLAADASWPSANRQQARATKDCVRVASWRKLQRITTTALPPNSSLHRGRRSSLACGEGSGLRRGSAQPYRHSCGAPITEASVVASAHACRDAIRQIGFPKAVSWVGASTRAAACMSATARIATAAEQSSSSIDQAPRNRSLLLLVEGSQSHRGLKHGT